MRVLLVEDEVRLAAVIQQMLRDQQFVSDVAHDGQTGLELALTDSYDALILDIMLPKLSGIEIVKQVRKTGLDVPILLLTARDSVDDRVLGLDVGADDYLVKPFANRELLARLRALTRRQGSLSGTDTMEAGPFSIDLTQRIAQRDGVNLSLTLKEFQLLELLMRNHDRVLSKELILDRVWGPEAPVFGNAVENYVHFLRKKIDVVRPAILH